MTFKLCVLHNMNHAYKSVLLTTWDDASRELHIAPIKVKVRFHVWLRTTASRCRRGTRMSSCDPREQHRPWRVSAVDEVLISEVLDEVSVLLAAEAAVLGEDPGPPRGGSRGENSLERHNAMLVPCYVSRQKVRWRRSYHPNW
jgi:hypothetical protein